MARILLSLIAVLAPMASFAADDLKVSQLEQDVRDLQRQVRAQAQQIDELRIQLGRPAVPPRVPSTGATSATSANSVGTWVDGSRWQRIKTGMTELEVIGLLGPPTSMRAKDSDRVLLYAMEIGSSGFLSGSVTLRDRVVQGIQVPALR